MAYRVGWQPDLMAVELVFEGTDSFVQHLEAVAYLHELVGKHRASRVLVDLYALNTPTTLSRAEQLQLSESIDQVSFAHCAFAVVLPESPECQNDWYFVTHFVRDAGITGEPFYNRAEAEAWLMSLPE